MLTVTLSLLFISIGYLLGSIPTGYLIARARGVDIQKVGSGNIGATNILRSLGALPALVVVLMDPLKGYLAILLPILFTMDSWTIALSGFAAVIGNNFNIFLKLRGGKGIATSLGVFLGVEPLTTSLVALLGIATIALGRYVSLGSLVGMMAAPLMLLSKGSFLFPNLYLAIAMMLLAMLRHRENILRLAKGTERRLGDKAKTNKGDE